MTNEILKLAKECGAGSTNNGTIVIYQEGIEAFYRAAFNAGIEAAAKVCESQEDLEYATGKVDHNERSWCSHLAQAIRGLR